MNFNEKVNLSGLLKDLDIHPDFIDKYDNFLKLSSDEQSINNGLLAMMMMYLNYQNVIPKIHKKNNFSEDELNKNLKSMRTFMVRLFASLDDYSQNNLYRFFYEKVYELLIKNKNVNLTVPLTTDWHKNLMPMSLYNNVSLESLNLIIVITSSPSIYALKIAEIIRDINDECPGYKEKVDFICIERDKESPLILNKEYMKEAFKIMKIVSSDDNLVKETEIKLKNHEDKIFFDYLKNIQTLKGDHRALAIKQVCLVNSWKKILITNLVSNNLNWVTVALNSIVSYVLFNVSDEQCLFEKYSSIVSKNMILKGDFKTYTLDIDIGLMINTLTVKSNGQIFNLDNGKIKNNMENLKVLYNIIDYDIKSTCELKQKKEQGLIVDEKLLKEDLMMFKESSIQKIVNDFLGDVIFNFLNEVNVNYELKYIKGKPFLRVGVIDYNNKYNNNQLYSFIENTILDKTLDLEKIEDMKESILMMNDVSKNKIEKVKNKLIKY